MAPREQSRLAAFAQTVLEYRDLVLAGGGMVVAGFLTVWGLVSELPPVVATTLGGVGLLSVVGTVRMGLETKRLLDRRRGPWLIPLPAPKILDHGGVYFSNEGRSDSFTAFITASATELREVIRLRGLWADSGNATIEIKKGHRQELKLYVHDWVWSEEGERKIVGSRLKLVASDKPETAARLVCEWVHSDEPVKPFSFALKMVPTEFPESAQRFVVRLQPRPQGWVDTTVELA